MNNVKGRIQSIQKNGKVDVFDNQWPFNRDHIWPLSKGGSDSNENKICLSQKTNNSKQDKTSGHINGIRFAVKKASTEFDAYGNQHIYGRLYIKTDEGWYEVTDSNSSWTFC